MRDCNQSSLTLRLTRCFCHFFMYSDPDKTKELEDDMKAIFKCI